jgi:hypothetical protein
MSPQMDYGEYGRCEAIAKSTDERCGRPAVGQHGKCDIHGGGSPTGEDSPHFEHGLFSDHLGEQDRETIAALEEYDDAEKLDELVNWRLARLRRAVRALNEDSQQNFWAAFSELVEQTGEPEADQIKQLAKMLSSGNRAMQDEIDLVRKLIKDHNQIAEGQDVNLSGDEAWRAMLAGGSDD